MMLTPDLEQRVKLYLKPIGGSYCAALWLMILDTVLSWLFVFSHIWYMFFAKYDHVTDKLMLAIIGPAFTGVFWIYAFFDAFRFLPRWYDKLLYFISCLF
jgi:hypothetical protein